jgi:hypothetical protein
VDAFALGKTEWTAAQRRDLSAQLTGNTSCGDSTGLGTDAG